MRHGAWALGAIAAFLVLAHTSAQSQTPDPFVRPPPGQAPQAPRVPPQQNVPTVTVEMLVRQGFEVKAVERGSERNAGFLVILQRSGEIRTCLMQITRDANRNPRRESFCF